MVSGLNRGLDPGGKPLGHATRFLCATGAEPAAQDYARELARLRAKVEAGAELVMTQPVYDAEMLDRFLDDVAPLGVPVLVGLLPLASHRNAEFLHNEVPGMRVPEAIRERMRKAGSGPKARAEGVAIAREMLAGGQGPCRRRVHHAAVRALRSRARHHRGDRALMLHGHQRGAARTPRAACGGLLMCAMLAGCASIPRPKQPFVDPAQALTFHQLARERVQSIRAEARVDQRGSEGRIKGTVLMFVQRPDRVRFDAMTQFGPAAILTSTGERFAYADLRNRRFLTGATCPKNIARMLNMPLRVDQTTALLLGGTPVIDHVQAQIDWNDGGFYRVELRGRDGGSQEIDFGISERDAAFPPSRQELRLLRSEIFDRRAQEHVARDVRRLPAGDVGHVPCGDAVRGARGAAAERRRHVDSLQGHRAQRRGAARRFPARAAAGDDSRGGEL